MWHHFHFISDWEWQQPDMKIFPFTRFCFHLMSDEGYIYAATHPWHCSALIVCFFTSYMYHKRLVVIMWLLRVKLIPDLMVYTIFAWFHATSRAFSFEGKKRYEAFRNDVLSTANPI